MTTSSAPPAPLTAGDQVPFYTSRLWEAVRAGDEYAAGTGVRDALTDGVPPETLLLDVIGGVQRRVGAEWAANRLSVAQEHAATAINERVIALLAQHPDVPPVPPARGRITVACVDGEWHALPARLLAEVLRLRGWRVDYLGAQVPAPHLIAHLHLTNPDLVALSSSLVTRLPAAHATITACQATGVPVLVGGAAFGSDGRHARQLGADAWAPDARQAAERLRRPLTRRKADHQAIDDLPHLADQEYTLAARGSRQLVREVLAGLESRFPTLLDYDDVQRDHTAQDVAHLVEFLTAALYTDDTELFSGFLVWTADVLRARAVPPESLLPALDLLERALRDFPRAVGLITRSRQALSRALRASGPPAARQLDPGQPA
ncbi:B12-binding domain-containing protein [Streptomyces noursei]|uniref:cobalamin B12-binding domain-containing protein n=1 Tax=Streptomyces noursei TaxID=1971 RepID=UPI00045EEC64|nr:cobalamin-dependent protein [Streptomyces noursei]AIA01288.1 cobalamin B12-binding domain-containing protein [Streptomyces noursei]